MALSACLDLKCVSVTTATSLPQFAKSVVRCSTAPGLDKAALAEW